MNKLKKGEASKQLQCARKMPPLKHKVGDSEDKFDVTKSEVSQWLMQQPEIMQYIFTRIKNSGFIVYNPDEKLWYGRDNYNGQKQYNGLTLEEIFSMSVNNNGISMLTMFAEHMGISKNEAKVEIKLDGSFWIDGDEVGKKKSDVKKQKDDIDTQNE